MNFSIEFWQELVDTLDTGIFVTDGQRRIVYANELGRAVVLQRSLEVTGERLDELLSELEPLFKRADELSGGEIAWRPIVIELPDSASPLFHAKVTRRPSFGPEPGDDYVIVLQRITAELQAGLNPKRSVSALMPTFLHELKNPLAAISTSVELLLEDLPPGEELHDEMVAIFGEIRRMKLVLDGVGLVGKPLRVRSRFDVQKSLREACTVLQPLAKRKGITFHVNIANYTPLPFDPGVLKAILFNLVMNAIHACNEGPSITVTSTVAHNTFTLIVEDTGQGMSREDLERCTRLFFTTKPFGSGIGLALCREVAVEAGGQLEIDSSLGVGTRVSFHVPIDQRGHSRA